MKAYTAGGEERNLPMAISLDDIIYIIGASEADRRVALSELTDGLSRVASGESVIARAGRQVSSGTGVAWAGRDREISDQQSEIVAVIKRGKRNTEIAELAHLGRNTAKDLPSIALQQNRSGHPRRGSFPGHRERVPS